MFFNNDVKSSNKQLFPLTPKGKVLEKLLNEAIPCHKIKGIPTFKIVCFRNIQTTDDTVDTGGDI